VRVPWACFDSSFGRDRRSRREQAAVQKQRARSGRMSAMQRRHAALLALVLASCTAQRASAHGIHALAQGRATRVATQNRVDFLGSTLYSAAGCSNELTCGPSYCARASNVDAVNTRGNMTDASFVSTLGRVTTRTCSISADARCSAAALAALFGRYPGVKAAYCNDGWLVMHSNNMPNHPSFLASIQTPPGDGDGGAYETQGVTRSYSLQHMAFKVPLSPVLLSTGAYTNNAGYIGYTAASDDLFSQNGQTHMPTSGPAAYALNGMPWFPNLNNQARAVLRVVRTRARVRGPALGPGSGADAALPLLRARRAG
jgi:hypothetical protein